jgi:hypothetical protein
MDIDLANYQAASTYFTHRAEIVMGQHGQPLF